MCVPEGEEEDGAWPDEQEMVHCRMLKFCPSGRRMDELIDLHQSIEAININLLFCNLVSPLFSTFALLSYVAVYRFVWVYHSTV
jgi:hypothetical protein